jgi:hypothetical protein
MKNWRSPDFFRDYMNARQIVDLRGGRGNGGNNPTPLTPQTAPGVKANHRRSCAMKAIFGG